MVKPEEIHHLGRENPTCYIVAGPNGAGKTTFAMRYLPQIAGCDNFINADLIAGGISPLNPARVQIAAGRILLKEIERCIAAREDFAFETTLSGQTYFNLVKRLKADGWQVVLIYLWIPNAEFSALRVAERVIQGGHDIPKEAILRRYDRSLNNLMNLFIDECSKTIVYDNRTNPAIPICIADSAGVEILKPELYPQLGRFIHVQ